MVTFQIHGNKRKLTLLFKVVQKMILIIIVQYKSYQHCQNLSMNYPNTFGVLHKFQSGFRSGHSTETALTLMTERWLKAINDGNKVGTIMIAFRKAFDLVDHDLLIN